MAEHHGEALDNFLLIKRINRTKLAEDLGVTRKTLYNWIERSELDMATLELLKSKIGFKPEADVSGAVVNDPSVEYRTKNTQMYNTPKFKPNIIYVPLYAYGGFMTGYRDTIFIDSLERFSLPGVMGEHFAFEISGMSMYKSGDELSASPGDIAISRPVEGLHYLMPKKGYILQTVEGILYKIFDKMDDKAVHVHSLNEEYDGLKIPIKELKRAYFVDFILKKTK